MQEQGSPRRRRQKTSPSMEQYIETIADLLTQDRVCSVSDIAAHANVSRPAASRAVRELAGKGLVEHQSYGYVVLSPDGEALARRLTARHKAIFRFLANVLRYEPGVADREACRLEHLVDDEFVGRLAQLTVFLDSDHDIGDRWQERMKGHLGDSM